MENKLKFVVFSLGCKVNQYEGRAMIEKIKEYGYEATDELGYADIYIINTCSVTMEADKKSRQCVSRVLKYNPDAKIYICGCSSQNDASKYMNKPNVRLIFGSFGKIKAIDSIMSDIVLDIKSEKEKKIFSMPKEYEDDLTPELTKSRAFIKVQDGCDNFCSYCIIPYLRGRSRSRSIASIMEEAQYVADKTNEIVITGINVSDYGSNIGKTLVDLVRELGKINIRKRFGSLECNIIDDVLLKEMKCAGFCDSFHLSMQSGSDSVLKRMNRHYTSSQFLEKIKLIRQYFPNASITTDIIVGFPEETDEEFNETLVTVDAANFSDIHIFPYSIRPGTVAAKKPQVSQEKVNKRMDVLKDKKELLNRNFIQSQLGNTSNVFVEEHDIEYNVGYTSNYIKVYTNSPIGSFVEHKLITYFKNGAIGEEVK